MQIDRVTLAIIIIGFIVLAGETLLLGKMLVEITDLIRRTH